VSESVLAVEGGRRVRNSTYEKLVELLDRLETIEAIRNGLEEMKAGKGRPATEVLERIREKYRIPRSG
jgi:hypothetical protein